MTNFRELLAKEPVIIIGLVEAAIILAVSFGLELSQVQTGAIMGFVAILTSFVARLLVSPVDKEYPFD